MSDRPPQRPKPPAPVEEPSSLSQRRAPDATAGRYSMTTDRPPPRARKVSAPPSKPPSSSDRDPERTMQLGSWNPNADPPLQRTVNTFPGYAAPEPTPPPQNLPKITGYSSKPTPPPDSDTDPTTAYDRTAMRDALNLTPQEATPPYLASSRAYGSPSVPPLPAGSIARGPAPHAHPSYEPPPQTSRSVHPGPNVALRNAPVTPTPKPTQMMLNSADVASAIAQAHSADMPIAPPAAPSVSQLTPSPRLSTPLPRPAPPPRKSIPDDTPAWQGEFDPGQDVDWQKLWLATQRRAWRSLVIVPSGDEADSLPVAKALSVVAFHHLGKTIRVVDATKLTLGELESRSNEVALHKSRGDTVIIALSPLRSSPASLTLAQSADAAILCVSLGRSDIAAANEALDQIGRDRFLGSIILKSPSESFGV